MKTIFICTIRFHSRRYKPFHENHVRNLIDDAILQMDRHGEGLYVGDDYIHVGNINDAQDVAIGKKSECVKFYLAVKLYTIILVAVDS